jgi:hypothetical protein
VALVGISSRPFAQRLPVSGGASITYDSDAQAYFTAAPSSTSATWKDAVNACIVGMKADGDWAGLDWLTFPAVGSDTYRNARNPAKTNSGAGTVTINDYLGVVGDGSSGYIAMPENLDAAGNQFSLNSGMVAVYCNQDNGGGSTNQHIGAVSGSRANVTVRNNAGNELFVINDASSASVFMAGVLTRKGFRMLNRPDSATKRGFYNGSKVADLAVASTATTATPTFFLRNSTTYSPDRIAGMMSGAGVTDAAAGRLAARYHTCMTAIGANY